jgi:hypothetical protein
MKLVLIIFVIFTALALTERLGDFIVAKYEGSSIKGIQELINQGENFLNNNRDKQYFSQELYKSRFGVVVQFTFRKGYVFQHPALPHAEYTRVIKGRLLLTSRNLRYTLNQKDGILIPGNVQFNLANEFDGYTTTISVDAPISNSIDLSNYKPYQYNKTEILKTNLNMGKLYVFDQQEIDINQIGERLRRQGERLVSASIGINKGISGTMFVLRGISGCHRHQRSDYIAYNGYGGSMQHIKFPEKFNSSLNDPVMMPINYVHNLISHRTQDVNVMLIFQFPAQTSSDSISATGCMEP